ncbi:MAG: valine--tRNA ligase [Spirochaetia bacterium]|nr:MAG: valine--tRNA ligase [Spirochaetia bacterium]
MSNSFDKPYNPKDVEEKIYEFWEKSGYFAPEAHQPQAGNPNNDKTFTITVPPPNITGSLHLGHALNATIQDILIRKKRMEGYKTLWLPGTDHAGIATQNVVEKDLKKQGISRHDLGKEKFLEKIWEWKEKYGHIILNQFKKLGASMDWSRTRFTMDSGYQEAVKKVFLHYHEKGWMYKAERIVNWCSRCATSLSDLELEYKEIESSLYYIKYPLKDGSGFVIVATTRPETMLGDSAVAVNPKDEKYKPLVGKTLILPIVNREIPIVADFAIDATFGTGAVKVTPAHDFIDAEIGERNKLEIHKIIGQNGRMVPEAGAICEGLKISKCREKVIEKLKELGLLEKEEPYKHNVAVCYRCDTIIEPLPSLQWFLKMDNLAKMAIDEVKSGRIKFHPQKWEGVYLNWLENVKDWCVSRQIWWGHKVPIEGEEDVLDTWFSSALWPFATLGWSSSAEATADKPDSNDFKEFYPTQILSTARDIINLWVTRMIFSGVEFTGKKPFSDVIIHATILTKDGKRMSKSLGTGIDPMTLIEKYGADATRFGLIWQAMGGQDIHWAEEHVMAGKKFCNKIWNATRFVLKQIADCELRITEPQIENQNLTEADKQILEKLKNAKESVSKQTDAFEFGQALHDLYDFFWRDFCDIYIEENKKQNSLPAGRHGGKEILLYVLASSIKLLHPFMPFITEEIWQNLPVENKKALIIESW